MRYELSPDEVAFRAEVRAFLQARPDCHLFFGENDPARRDFSKALAERNWLALSWPTDVGGMGLGSSFEFILWDELARHRVMRPPLSAGIVAKTIIRYGDDAQKQRWLEPIRRGDVHFALGYSEPEAGSDLAGLTCRAERDGDAYVITGTKVWNSSAPTADYIWLLCRTGEPGSRGRGLSLLIVDREAPGLSIRPIQTIDGAVFSEMQFDAVRVDRDRRIGDENAAWTMMNASLADERHVNFSPARLQADFEAVLDAVTAAGLAGDPEIEAHLAELAVDVLEAEAHGLRVLDGAVNGHRSGALEAAANKLAYADVAQKISRTAMMFGLPSAVLHEGALDAMWRSSMIESIGGGTSEIMTGIIARARLGLGGK